MGERPTQTRIPPTVVLLLGGQDSHTQASLRQSPANHGDWRVNGHCVTLGRAGVICHTAIHS